MSAVAHIPVVAFVSEEDRARARWYAFLARLFREPPDEALLSSLAASAAGVATDPAPDEPPLQRAWRDFVTAAGGADPEAVRDEFDRTFIGTGKAPVPPNGSYFIAGFLNERPLVDLREQLARLGLARRETVSETEDHISSLCEVMAHLIAGDDVAERLAAQREFFDRFIAAWYERFADALEGCGETEFYRAVARLMRCYFEVERLSFAFET
jgi:TorA maturation chaperone TorD